MRNRNLRGNNAITLIALIVTIIVLLMLAGISIGMLTGENGIINHAGNAKKLTELAEIEEEAGRIYIELYGRKKISEGEPTLEEVITELKKLNKYTIADDEKTGSSITGIKLVGDDQIAVEKGSTTEVSYTEISEATSGKRYFAVVGGEKYEITLDETKGEINISQDAETSTGTTKITVATSNGSKAQAQIDEENKKITIKGKDDGEEIKLQASINSGTAKQIGTITVKTLAYYAPAIYVGGEEVKTTLSLDGAMLLSAGQQGGMPSTTNNANYLWTSSNPEVVQVTTDGIIKCGSKTSNEADKEEDGSGTVTITLKGRGGSTKTCTVKSTAKTVSSVPSGSPAILDGFTAINTNDAKWTGVNGAPEVNKGLVMMDERGNQFVWVPVPDVIWDGKTTITTGKDLATESNPYTPMAQTNATTGYEGLLYTFYGTTVTYQSNWNLGTTNNREPDVLLQGEDSEDR